MRVTAHDYERLRESFIRGELVAFLRKGELLDPARAEAVAHALVDIAEALFEIYGEIAPHLLEAHNLEAFRDALLDLSEAFRHIDYHIHDAGLTDLWRGSAPEQNGPAPPARSLPPIPGTQATRWATLAIALRAQRGDNAAAMAGESELLLAQVWNAQWLAPELRTSEGQRLRVVYRGVWTHADGPDFTGALLELDGRLVSGDVELHRRASDWLAHGHHLDPAYERVALHVVLEDDLGQPVRRRSGERVPTLVLATCLPGPLASFPVLPGLRPLGAIGFDYCAPQVAATAPERIIQVWEAAGDARLAGKVARIAARLALEPPAQTLYWLLLDALGYSRNREGMRAVAERVPYDHLDSLLAGRSSDERRKRAAGLLLGVAGFLPLSPADEELAGLNPREARAIEQAWQLHGGAWRGLELSPTMWRLHRQRPANHPLRRLLALAWLLARDDQGLLPALLGHLVQPNAARALQNWLTRNNPYLGEERAHQIVVNVVVPFALAYGEAVEQEELLCAAGELWARLPAGHGNAIVRRTAEQICGPHQLRVPTARAEQGLLQLYSTGCRQLRCYECPIAHLALAWGRGSAEGAVSHEVGRARPAGPPEA